QGYHREDVGRSNRSFRVASGPWRELGRTEGLTERRCGLPDGNVHERAAPGGAAVELGGDEAGLPGHEGGVVCPDLEESLGVFGRHRELIYQHHRALAFVKLLAAQVPP